MRQRTLARDALLVGIFGVDRRRGGGGGFASVAEETGFDDPAWNYGLVAVDLDRDGYRELVVTGDGRPVEIWENPCGDGAWVDVRLVGVGQNVGSIGARVEIETSDGAIQVQEVHAMAAVQQHPLGLHFGLAPGLRVREVRARWPDGSEARLVAPGLGELELRHPAAGSGIEEGRALAGLRGPVP